MTSRQDPSSPVGSTRNVIDVFNEAFNRHDADTLESLLTDDTVFENTSPAPDGQRIVGKSAVAEFWRGWFARNPEAVFETEELVVCGDRAVVRWIYRKVRVGQPWHLRGVRRRVHGARRESGGEACVCERVSRCGQTCCSVTWCV